MPYSRLAQGLLIGASVVIILLGLRAAAEIVNAVVLAWVITLTCLPFHKWLQRKGIPHGLATGLTILLVILVLLGLILFVLVSLSTFANTLPAYVEGVTDEAAAIEAWLADAGLDFSGIFTTEGINSAAIIGFGLQVLVSILNSLTGAVFMFIIFVFMVLDAGGIYTRLTATLGQRSAFISRFSEYNHKIRDYIYITALAGILAGGADALLLALVGVDFPILWGVLAFFMSFIPSVGYFIALIPPTLLALAEFGVPEALIVFFGYWLINGTVDNLLKPRLMGQGLDLSPMVVFLSLVIWGWVLGVVGALLAVPLTMLVQKVVLEGFEETRWLAYAMSAGQVQIGVEATPEAGLEGPNAEPSD